jgi:capsular polysaccharide transport system permease protein
MTNSAPLGQQGPATANSGSAATPKPHVKVETPTAAAIPLPITNAARPARAERRHRNIGKSFVLAVIAPLVALAIYLWGFAEDQYASYLGFSVRSESARQPLELLGGLTGLGSFSTSDPEILYKFLNGQELLKKVDARVDLQKIWSKQPSDLFFAYHGDHTIELLLEHWQRKVNVYFDSGMIDVRVLAFDPKDAEAITQAIFEESSAMINNLNAIARDDTIRYAREELEKSVERLKVARQVLAEFRDKNQLVDPTANVQGQLGVLATLQQQLAEALINRGILTINSQDDPRAQQLDMRISVIENQIEQERKKFGGQSGDGEVLSSVVGEYELLQVDHQFAERAYTAALAAFDVAQSDAQRKSRYLAAYVEPTLAQSSEYPNRITIFITGLFFILTLWTIGVLIYYSIRNRR